MEKTDRQTSGKTTRWAFTAYEGQWHLFTTVIPVIVAEIGWQTEVCPKTGRKHYQGFIRTTRQARPKQLQDLYPGVHIEFARNWDALLNYCKKDKTAIEGTQVKMLNEQAVQLTMNQAMIKLAERIPYIDWAARVWLAPPKEAHQFLEECYWQLTRQHLRDFPEQVGLYTQPQYMRAWVNLYSVFLHQVQTINENTEWEFPEDEDEECVSETDRQTDVPAFILD